MPLATFGTGQVFWSMLWFFLFFIWIWLLIVVFSDIFRSQDLSGWAKALWTIFVIFLPYLGVFVYLIARATRWRGTPFKTPRLRTPPSASTSRVPSTRTGPARQTRSPSWQISATKV